MRISYRALVAASLVAAVTAACGTPDAAPDVDQPAPVPAQGSPDRAQERHPEGILVRIDGGAIELALADGETTHRWTLEGGETFHSFLVHPDATTDTVDVAALALDGERPVLYHVTARPGGASGIAPFPEHLQPSHEVDAGPPTLAWTPDGRSLVWTEPSGGSMVLRAVGWEDGPGNGRPADDNASFLLDAPGGAQVDGFEVTSASAWLLILRGGASTDPIAVPVERQSDGALSIPPAR